MLHYSKFDFSVACGSSISPMILSNRTLHVRATRTSTCDRAKEDTVAEASRRTKKVPCSKLAQRDYRSPSELPISGTNYLYDSSLQMTVNHLALPRDNLSHSVWPV
jgi:hypothetical protein